MKRYFVRLHAHVLEPLALAVQRREHAVQRKQQQIPLSIRVAVSLVSQRSVKPVGRCIAEPDAESAAAQAVEMLPHPLPGPQQHRPVTCGASRQRQGVHTRTPAGRVGFRV